jgi:hypothetical protein
MANEQGSDVLKRLASEFNIKEEVKKTLEETMDASFRKMLSADRISKKKKDGFVMEKRITRKIDALASESDIERDGKKGKKLDRKSRRKTVRIRVKRSPTNISRQNSQHSVDWDEDPFKTETIQDENKENVVPE